MGGAIVTDTARNNIRQVRREVTGTSRGKKHDLDVNVDRVRPSKENLFLSERTGLNASTAEKVVLPEDVTDPVLAHDGSGIIVWLGGSDSITAGGAGTFPLFAGQYLPLNLIKGNAAELYAIAASGTPGLYAAGTAKG